VRWAGERLAVVCGGRLCMGAGKHKADWPVDVGASPG
jgi:hypothetical protein